MGRTDQASLLVHVDRATVFAALTSPDALLSWLPPRGMHGRFEQFDMREGGSYRLVLTYDDASDAPGTSRTVSAPATTPKDSRRPWPTSPPTSSDRTVEETNVGLVAL